MSKQVRFRRGTTAQHAVFVGPAGEVTVDTDKDVTVVHNGVTAGGIPTAREDRPRGWTKTEYITATSQWVQTNKTDLKRIMVWAWGGGGNSGTHAGGGAGGYGFVVLEASAVPTNVTVTIGGAGGGTTSFGSFITCTGGANAAAATGGAPGSASGVGVINLGASAGIGGGTAIASPGQGGGIGGGNHGTAGKGITGSGGGGSGAAGSQGGVIIQEIYGFV